ncbi:MAG: DNA-binding response regulator [Chloroflexota bacterium]|nr:MAG: DNA-binding response regulator [Chloroflexota bacterium]
MGATRVLLVGRSQAKRALLISTLQKRYDVMLTTNGGEAQQLGAAYAPHAIVLDAVSMRTPGDRICRALRDAFGTVPIVHIHPGPEKGAESLADALLFEPVSSRRLTSAIDRLVRHGGDEVIICGPLALNVGRRMLTANGQEIQLTPKQTLLLELFLRRPWETLNRKTIMAEVWDTDYLGDTRTLDVHIRWIRQAIEADANRPAYLKTVRGVGYRLEIPAEPALEASV